MEIRRLRTEEHGRTRALYEEVFPEDSSSFVDYYYTEKTRDNQIYVAEEDGDIQAMLHLNPYVLMVNGSEKPADYIVAVATRKEYRKRGYMAALLRRALKEMYKEGHAFTYLMPAAEEIYLPHGFRTVCTQERRMYRNGDCGRPASEEDAEELSLAAGEFLARDYQVYVRRDRAYYQRLLKELASDGGSLMVSRREGRLADCRFYYPDEEGNGQEKPKIMARIVDVRRMLMSVRLTSLMAACFTVEDPVIEENHRCLTVTGTEFSGVMLMDGKPENSEGTVPVAALGELLFGAKSVEEISGQEGVVLSGRLAGELKKIVPLKKIFLNEAV